jgi:hypothetical protein
MRIMKSALAALFAVSAFSAMAASSASAWHPLFLTQSGKELLFSGEGSKLVLRTERAGLPATLECEKILIHGLALNLSTLAHGVLLLLHSKCLLKVNGGANETCNEPIELKLALAELGLLTSTNHRVVLLLAPSGVPVGTTTFALLECRGELAKISGTIVGEIPERNALGENQLNTPRNDIELVFATINKSNHQSISEIFLLGTKLTKQELTASGFMSGPTALEAAMNLKGDGTIEVSTTKM